MISNQFSDSDLNINVWPKFLRFFFFFALKHFREVFISKKESTVKV